jgi:inner membrane protein
MDSLTQIALGASVSVAVMGRRTAVWKAAAWGAVAGTLPDLDVVIDHHDPILNMVLHRAHSHALFWLALAAMPMGAAVSWLHDRGALWRRWMAAMGLALVTHPLLDALTVYGTQLLQPFSSEPYGLGSVFIIDPLVTLPWLAGTIWALRAKDPRNGLRANAIGLSIGATYLAWGVAAQALVTQRVQQDLQAQGLLSHDVQAQGPQTQRVLVTPAAFNSLLWRVLVMDGEHYLEGFHSLLDDDAPIHFQRFARGTALDAELGEHTGVQRLRSFSHGFYKVDTAGQALRITDLRMGVDPHYSFSFEVAEHRPGDPVLHPLPVARATGSRPALGRALAWWWHRSSGERSDPPR